MQFFYIVFFSLCFNCFVDSEELNGCQFNCHKDDCVRWDYNINPIYDEIIMLYKAGVPNDEGKCLMKYYNYLDYFDVSRQNRKIYYKEISYNEMVNNVNQINFYSCFDPAWDNSDKNSTWYSIISGTIQNLRVNLNRGYKSRFLQNIFLLQEFYNKFQHCIKFYKILETLKFCNWREELEKDMMQKSFDIIYSLSIDPKNNWNSLSYNYLNEIKHFYSLIKNCRSRNGKAAKVFYVADINYELIKSLVSALNYDIAVDFKKACGGLLKEDLSNIAIIASNCQFGTYRVVDHIKFNFLLRNNGLQLRTQNYIREYVRMKWTLFDGEEEIKTEEDPLPEQIEDEEYYLFFTQLEHNTTFIDDLSWQELNGTIVDEW